MNNCNKKKHHHLIINHLYWSRRRWTTGLSGWKYPPLYLSIAALRWLYHHNN